MRSMGRFMMTVWRRAVRRRMELLLIRRRKARCSASRAPSLLIPLATDADNFHAHKSRGVTTSGIALYSSYAVTT